MTAGSLSVTQTTLAKLDEAATDTEATSETSILLAPTMLRVAQMIGRALSETAQDVVSRMNGDASQASASLIVAGQRRGGDMRMFLIYPEGNFIEATADTPYLQIGEHKYGKPILDRVVAPDTSMSDARKAVLLSMDSTLRSNLSVGMPLDLATIRKDDCAISTMERIEDQDPKFRQMSADWSEALKNGFAQIES
ncbi:MAG: peptidase, partial [Pseudomonadota bacterium]